MRILRKRLEAIGVKSVFVYAKVSETINFSLKDYDGEEIANVEDRVPSFFPETRGGEYLVLEIELATGLILNWVKPNSEEVSSEFNLIEDDK